MRRTVAPAAVRAAAVSLSRAARRRGVLAPAGQAVEGP